METAMTDVVNAIFLILLFSIFALAIFFSASLLAFFKLSLLNNLSIFNPIHLICIHS